MTHLPNAVTVIGHAVWLYHRFTLSFRDVEDLLAERGVRKLVACHLNRELSTPCGFNQLLQWLQEHEDGDREHRGARERSQVQIETLRVVP